MSFTDDFNRVDQNLANADWTLLEGSPVGAAAIRTNQLACLATAGQGVTYLCPDQGNRDQYVEFEVRNVTASGAPFVICRAAINDNFIGIRNNGANLEVYKRVDLAFTRLSPTSNPQGIVVGDILRLEVEGADTWRAYKNGILTNSGVIGTDFTSTRQGVICRITTHNPWIDNFTAGTLAAPPEDYDGTGSIEGAGSIIGSGAKGASGSGAISSTTSIVSTGGKIGHGSGSLSAIGSIIGTGSKGVAGSGSVSAILALVGIGEKAAQGSGSIVVASNLTASGPVVEPADFDISIDATLDPTIGIQGTLSPIIQVTGRLL